MRQNYTCIGAYFDIQGFSLIRFDLVDRHFRILKTDDGDMPMYDKALRKIEKLAALKSTIDVQSIDVLSNFGTDLKRYIIQNHKSEHTIRIKTTTVNEQKENMIMNLYNAISQHRIIPDENDSLSLTALQEIRGVDRAKLKNVYEGNANLTLTLEAILHSISWLEGQMIKHQMI